MTGRALGPQPKPRYNLVPHRNAEHQGRPVECTLRIEPHEKPQRQSAARPEPRAKVRSQPKSYGWNIIDVVLAVLMLPFGIWFFLIEGMVRGVTAFGKR